MSIVRINPHWLPQSPDPVGSNVVLLMPLSDSPAALATADKSASALNFTLGDLSPGAFTTAISSDTLFGALTTQFMGGVGYVQPTSFNESHFNFAANSPAKLTLPTADWTMDAHFLLDVADGANSGGWIFNCGGLGYALANPPDYSQNYSTGMYGLFIGPDGTPRYGQGPVGSGAKQRLTGTTTAAGQYHHVRIVRYNTSTTPRLALAINGAFVVDTLQTVDMSGSPSFFVVGGLWNQSTPGPAYTFRGKLANVRIVKNEALTTTDFSPPSAPYPIPS